MSLQGVYRTAVDDLVALAQPLVERAGAGGRIVAVAKDDDLTLYEVPANGAPKLLPPGARKRGGQPTELRLPAEAVLMRTLALPAAGREYLDPIVEHRLERLIPWSPDRALYGYRVSGETDAPGRKQRDTADCDTPASRATSYEVPRRAVRGGVMRGAGGAS